MAAAAVTSPDWTSGARITQAAGARPARQVKFVVCPQQLGLNRFSFLANLDDAPFLGPVGPPLSPTADVTAITATSNSSASSSSSSSGPGSDISAASPSPTPSPVPSPSPSPSPSLDEWLTAQLCAALGLVLDSTVEVSTLARDADGRLRRRPRPPPQDESEAPEKVEVDTEGEGKGAGKAEATTGGRSGEPDAGAKWAGEVTGAFEYATVVTVEQRRVSFACTLAWDGVELAPDAQRQLSPATLFRACPPVVGVRLEHMLLGADEYPLYMAGLARDRGTPASPLTLRLLTPLFLRMVTGSTIELAVSTATSTVGDVKRQVRALRGIPEDVMQLVYKGRKLEDSQPLSAAGVTPEAILSLILPLRAGPVTSAACLSDVTDLPLGRVCALTSAGRGSGQSRAWRGVRPGLCIEGECTMPRCPARGRVMVVSLHTGMRALVNGGAVQTGGLWCPCCRCAVRPAVAGVAECEYRLLGVKVEFVGGSVAGAVDAKSGVESAVDDGLSLSKCEATREKETVPVWGTTRETTVATAWRSVPALNYLRLETFVGRDVIGVDVAGSDVAGGNPTSRWRDLIVQTRPLEPQRRQRDSRHSRELFEAATLQFDGPKAAAAPLVSLAQCVLCRSWVTATDADSTSAAALSCGPVAHSDCFVKMHSKFGSCVHCFRETAPRREVGEEEEGDKAVEQAAKEEQGEWAWEQWELVTAETFAECRERMRRRRADAEGEAAEELAGDQEDDDWLDLRNLFAESEDGGG